MSLMPDFEKLGAFYLGKEKEGGQIVLYDAKDLVTHAVCVGMTGSGKTGLCVSLLEEAAIDGIPALVIDPKGDLGNLLLAFPGLQPGDFEPWVNEDDARRKGVSTAEFAAQQAGLWKSGLEKWGQDGARIQRMLDAADFTIYTPGSDAGVPLSIMKSFAAPDEELRADRELMRDRVTATATSLLGMAGIDADPVQSREHALLANIFDSAWKNGEDLDLGGVIARVQKPPFEKVGVLDLESFYPSKDRFGLAMALNNLLASPGFECWLQGEPLDVGSLLYTPQGKPRISIFSIAHLSDSERMFFVSLLLNQTLSWVRTQPGTTSLRALLYMDEIFGYFPPTANPPSKKPLLTLLKQARAFGFGVVLATQNPVDLDYKGLANTGTWFIGRLQTERDKARVMEGLEGASAAGGGKFDRQKMEQTLAGLGNRVFLLNSVHDDTPVLFETRWAMSYLRGPLARTEIKRLMAPRKQKPAEAEPASQPPAGRTAAPKAAETPAHRASAPVLPPDVPQYFVPLQSRGEAVYQPRLLAGAQVQFREPKAGIDELRELLVAVPLSDSAVAINWDAAEILEVAPSDLAKEPEPEARFVEPPSVAARGKNYAAWQRAFATWVYQTQKIEVYRSVSLDEVSKPGESEAQFRLRLQQRAREERDRQIDKLRQKYAPKVAALEERQRRAQAALEREKEQSQGEMLQSVINVGTGLLGAFLGGSRRSSSMASRAGTALRSINRARKESGDVGRAEDNVEALQAQIQELNTQFETESASLSAAIDPSTEALEPLVVKPKKTGITVQLCGLGWIPAQ